MKKVCPKIALKLLLKLPTLEPFGTLFPCQDEAGGSGGKRNFRAETGCFFPNKKTKGSKLDALSLFAESIANLHTVFGSFATQNDRYAIQRSLGFVSGEGG